MSFTGLHRLETNGGDVTLYNLQASDMGRNSNSTEPVYLASMSYDSILLQHLILSQRVVWPPTRDR